MNCRIVLSGLIFCLLLNTCLFASDTEMSVQNREAKLKARPTPFAEVLETLSLAQRVTVIERGDVWTKVKAQPSGRVGWLSSQSLTEKELKLTAVNKETRTTASSGEMGLATKGFSPEVEKADRKSVV